MDRNYNPFQSISKEAKTVFSLIQKKGPVTKNKLLEYTKMKLSTLNRVMQPLEEIGLIVNSGIGDSTGGRKPMLYSANDKEYYLLGIDISRTYTQVLVTNLKMDILNKHQFAMSEKHTPEATVKFIRKSVRMMTQELSIPCEQILGAGIGTVGPLNRISGVMGTPRNFMSPSWNNTPIKDMVEQELGLPVFIDNGANTAVLAEFLYGVGKQNRNIAYFNCGIGIRTGAISSGILVRTIKDAEDVFGHMIIDVDGEPCFCGNYGCIDRYSSILAITKKFQSEIKKGRISSIVKLLKDINYIDICNAAEQNDELSREIIIGAATIFGAGLANYINLFDPGLVVLSGPLISHSKLFSSTVIDAALKKYYLKGERRVVFSRRGFFKDNAIAVGAAAMVVETYLQSRILG